MIKQYVQMSIKLLPIILDNFIVGIDLILECIYKYIDLPLQKTFCYFGNRILCYYRRRTLIDIIKNFTQILVQSYFIAFFLYFILLLFAQLFSIAIQKYYFIDPLLSNNRQCVNIKFVYINNSDYIHNNNRLKNNFLKENFIIRNESYRKELHDYSELYRLLNILENNYYMICQRSLYLYARFQAYSPLLHSNYSQFRFSMSKYPSSFSIDQPPFLDLCVHTFNNSHLEKIKSQLLPLSSYYYSSVNLFVFDFNFTQVSITLYELNGDSTHLERVSIHTGWLRDIYSQFYFFKYDYALSTVLFDGLSIEQDFVDFFNYTHIPVSADPLLGLNEMIQQMLLVLPLCQSMNNK